MQSVDICRNIPWSSGKLCVNLMGSRESSGAFGIHYYAVGTQPGVLVVDLGGNQVVCVRKVNEIVSEFIAEQLAVGLNVTVARSRIVRPDEAEFSEIAEMLYRCRPRMFEKEMKGALDYFDAASPVWKQMREQHMKTFEQTIRTFGRRTSLAVLEFIQGTSFNATSEETLLSLGFDLWEALGSLCALDIVLNNMDRIPLPIFDNREGNLSNVIVTSNGAVGIDQQINVIKSEDGMETYLGRVRDFVQKVLHIGASASDSCPENPQTNPVIACIAERIRRACGTVTLTDEQALVLVQALRSKLLEIAEGWTSGTVAGVIERAEVAASERIIATQRLIEDDKWTAPKALPSVSTEEAQACADFLRRVVVTICEAKEEWMKTKEAEHMPPKDAVEQSNATSKLSVSAEVVALRAAFFTDCLLDDARKMEVSKLYSDDAPKSDSGTWSVDKTAKLCDEGFYDESFAAKAELLKPEQFTSVSKAVERLNSANGTRACLEGMCMVFSSSKSAYFLIYREDMKEKAFSMFNLTDSWPDGHGEITAEVEDAERAPSEGMSST